MLVTKRLTNRQFAELLPLIDAEIHKQTRDTIAPEKYQDTLIRCWETLHLDMVGRTWRQAITRSVRRALANRSEWETTGKSHTMADALHNTQTVALAADPEHRLTATYLSPNVIARLQPRWQDLACRINQGETTTAIAEALCVTPRTIQRMKHELGRQVESALTELAAV